MDKTSVGAWLSVVFVGLAQSVHADAPKIENVTLVGTQLSVTLSHPDTGWDHYADRWLVFDLSGDLIAERVLLHPHVTEQPFARSSALPDNVQTGEIKIVASCNHGDESAPYTFKIDE